MQYDKESILNFDTEYDRTLAGTQIFSAIKGDLSINCMKSPQEFEPTNVSISRRFDNIKTIIGSKIVSSILKRL